tara:strand:- start:557 stop:916 length:360 start_codon:yes stop_codon:yes gene_type:complete
LSDTFLLKVADLDDTEVTTIYTCPTTDDSPSDGSAPIESTTAIVKSIIVSEDTDNASTITVTVTRSSAVFSVYKDFAITAKKTEELLTNPLVLNEGDIVNVTAGHANRLHVLLSVMEIT